MSNLLKKEKGFTLIEIVLVLAIAGLLLVIVFLAVSGAQKSRRDSQRKNDLSRIAAQLESYASNNNGAYPTAAVFTAGFKTTYLDTANLNSPSSGNDYTYNASAQATPATDTVSYNATNTRTYTVCIGLEQGASCRSNQ